MRRNNRNLAPVHGHLPQVDLLRVITFGAVIAVHTIAQVGNDAGAPDNAVQMLFHFTRAGFFMLTGFVLFHTNYRKPLDPRSFWKRRFPVVLIPYVVWTAIYCLQWTSNTATDPAGTVKHFAWALATGQGQYHLYFLLVSMQIYALFPILLAIVRRTQGWHLQLLGVVLAINAVFLGWLHYANHSAGVSAVVANHSQELLVTYIAYILIGALAAVHLQRLQLWVQDHYRAIAFMTIVAFVITQVGYYVQIESGTFPESAADALQPLMMLWSVAVTLGLYAAGVAWAQHRVDGRMGRFVEQASTMSFGIYLAHPLVLSAAGNLGFRYGTLPMPTVLAALVVWLMAATVSAVLVAAILRTPLALVLTGRRRLKRPELEVAEPIAA